MRGGRIVVHGRLPRVSSWALAVCLWAILRATGSAGVNYDQFIPSTEAKTVLNTLYGSGERAYRSRESHRFNGHPVEMGKNGLRGKFCITSQRKSVR